MKLKVIGTSIVALACLLLVFVWLANGFVPKLSTDVVAEKPVQKPEIVTAIQREVIQYRAFSGSIQARQQATISARITARVAEVLVNAGDRVETGDVLLRLENDDLSSRVRQQEQSLAAAQARVNEARANYQRVETVVTRGVLPEARLDEARANRDSAEADLIRAREALSEARTSESFSVILAPFSGVVSRRSVYTGDTATPGMALLSLYSAESLRLEAPISESVLPNVQIGDELMLSLDAVQKELVGFVVEIEPAADSASRSFIIRVVPNHLEGLYPGMYGRIFVPTGKRELIHVPESAITQIGQLHYVQVWRENQLERRIVRLGGKLNFRETVHYEVVSGLTVGESVLLNGAV